MEIVTEAGNGEASEAKDANAAGEADAEKRPPEEPKPEDPAPKLGVEVLDAFRFFDENKVGYLRRRDLSEILFHVDEEVRSRPPPPPSLRATRGPRLRRRAQQIAQHEMDALLDVLPSSGVRLLYRKLFD